MLDDILAVVSEKNIYKDNSQSIQVGSTGSYWFEIITQKRNYLICAETEQDMLDWVECIECGLRSLRSNQAEPLVEGDHGFQLIG